MVTEQWVVSPVDGGAELETEERLVFEGAPERGLIVLESPDHEENVRGYPPVGPCYDATGGEFSTVYDDCLRPRAPPRTRTAPPPYNRGGAVDTGSAVSWL